jgi:hypothetical protein
VPLRGDFTAFAGLLARGILARQRHGKCKTLRRNPQKHKEAAAAAKRERTIAHLPNQAAKVRKS